MSSSSSFASRGVVRKDEGFLKIDQMFFFSRLGFKHYSTHLSAFLSHFTFMLGDISGVSVFFFHTRTKFFNSTTFSNTFPPFFFAHFPLSHCKNSLQFPKVTQKETPLNCMSIFSFPPWFHIVAVTIKVDFPLLSITFSFFGCSFLKSSVRDVLTGAGRQPHRHQPRLLRFASTPSTWTWGCPDAVGGGGCGEPDQVPWY